jgi:hypothetical protein
MYNHSPYKTIPKKLIDRYTSNGKIPIYDRWFDGSKRSGVTWTNKSIDILVSRLTPLNIKSNREGCTSYGHSVTHSLLKSFEKYNIKGMNVAVIGSETPWIEAILINLGNKITTIEYNVPECNYDKITCKDYFSSFTKTENLYDCIVTFSSIEHSGLGRYGDPLDPEGDIKTMLDIHKNLKRDGILIWGAPVGCDALVWNAHRIYGKIRLPLLFNKFKEVEWIDSDKDKIMNIDVKRGGTNQPVVVLIKE